MRDEQFLKSLGIETEGCAFPPEAPTAELPAISINIQVEDGIASLSIEDLNAILSANHNLHAEGVHLNASSQNWCTQAGEADKQMRIWRRIAIIFGGSIAASLAMDVWGWLR